MNSIMIDHLNRMEQAINALLDSVVANNPSIEAAEEVVEADRALSDGLNLMACHRRNHEEHICLRAESAALDQKIQDAVKQLAEARAELLAHEPSDTNADANPVNYAELMSMAQRISKFTVPPAGANVLAAATEIRDYEQDTQPEVKEKEKASSTGVAPNSPETPQQGVAYRTLEEGERAWLNPMAQNTWLPYPSEDMIRRSALALSQEIIRDDVAATTSESIGASKATEDKVVAAPVREQTTLPIRRESIHTQPNRSQEPPAPVIPTKFDGLDLYDPSMED